MNDSVLPKMSKGAENALKELCDDITKRLETEQGKNILERATASMRNGMIDKFHLITVESVMQMIVLHMATLPVFDALFGERGLNNPITQILNVALLETLEIEIEDEEKNKNE